MPQLYPSIAKHKNFYKFTLISKPEPNNGTNVAELYSRYRTLMTLMQRLPAGRQGFTQIKNQNSKLTKYCLSDGTMHK